MKTSSRFDPVSPFRKNNTTLNKIWPEYEYRPQQEAMAEAVRNSIRGKKILFVEAGTGTGKTIAYLLPLLHFAVENNVRVAISTETRALQKQILENDVPIAERLLETKIAAEICLGNANYICKRKQERVFREGSYDPDMHEHLEEYLIWEKTTQTGSRMDYTGVVTGYFWDSVTRNPEDCLGARCPNFSSSYYFLAREKWKKARLLIINHSLLANHIAADRNLLPEFQTLVIDEAHRFPDVFSSSFQESVSLYEINSLIKTGGESSLSLQESFTLFQKEIFDSAQLRPGERKRIRSAFKVHSAARFLKDMDIASEELRRQISSSQEELLPLGAEAGGGKTSDRDERTLQLQARLAKFTEQKNIIIRFLAGPGEEGVNWFSRPENDNRENLYMTASDIHPGKNIRTGLLDEMECVILTSATLTSSANRPFDFFMQETGVNPETIRQEDRVESLKLDSPFDYRSNCVLYLPSGIPDPSAEEEKFHEKTAELIGHLMDTSRGGTFALFTSARSLKHVRKILEEDPDFDWEIISQLEHGPVRGLSLFLNSERSILLGLATFWQGIDIPGSRLRMVIIVRLPFRVPDEPILEARMDLDKKAGRNPFFTIQLPQAAISIKQGFGRLIRTASDTGAVCIVDPRITTRSYGKMILETLPPARLVRKFSEFRTAVKGFFP